MDRILLEKALEARKNSYCPYSGFAVGAALLAKNGKIYTGCNVETCTFTPTSCAERTALFKAISEGEREFSAIAIVGAGKDEEPSSECPPCGVCRQALAEFCAEDFRIILGTPDKPHVYTLSELLPQSFNKDRVAK